MQSDDSLADSNVCGATLDICSSAIWAWSASNAAEPPLRGVVDAETEALPLPLA
jgi:hypothetical protein